MTLDDLDLPITDLIALTPPPRQLYEAQTLLSAAKAKLKAREQVFNALLERLYGDRAKAVYQAERKDTGMVHLHAGNTLTLSVERDKDVEWDQAILKTTLSAMDAADRDHYAKVKIAVDERKFSAAPPAIRTALERARTVKPGKMKFTFKEVELV